MNHYWHGRSKAVMELPKRSGVRFDGERMAQVPLWVPVTGQEQGVPCSSGH